MFYLFWILVWKIGPACFVWIRKALNLRMRHIFRYILVAVGTLSCVLGIIGIFVPVLPTTPFLLLSAALYFRSSPKLYRLLLNHRTLGPYIKNFREHKSIPLRVKIISVSRVWISLLHCAFLFSSDWVISASFIVLAVLITVYLLHFKTSGKDRWCCCACFSHILQAFFQ